ncbi:MAG: ThiF family adenylyltransferase [Candidatus Omnitrophota bacterium]
MFSKEEQDAIEEFFKGTQNIAENTISGMFHLRSVPASPIQEITSGQVNIKIVTPAAYPQYESPQAFFVDEPLWIFPHVRMDDGKICPPDSRRWFENPTLRGFLEYLSEFLTKAAENNLEAKEDYYELPQFPVAKPFHLVFVERDPQSWISRTESVIGFFSYAVENQLIQIRRFNIDPKALNSDERCGIYIWYKKEPVLRYKRPPIYFRELAELLESEGLSFENLVREGIKLLPEKKFIVILGFPIKETNGGPFNDIHWQSFLLDISAYYQISRKQRKKNKKKKVDYNLAVSDYRKEVENTKVEYFKSHDCSLRFLYSRIGGQSSVNNCAVFGCGAIGSHLLVFLAKSGIARMIVCDHETIEAGNLCRHALHFSSVGKLKASEMGKVLKDINPWGDFSVALTDILNLTSDSKEMQQLLEYDLWIDAGLPVKASLYLVDLAKKHSKRMVSAFITNKAKYLIIAISGKNSSPDINEILTQMRIYMSNSDDSDLKGCLALLESPEKDIGIRPNTGCYFMTFEASEARMSATTSILYSCLNELCGDTFEKGRYLIYGYDDKHFTYKIILDSVV